jgi:hypothetical protein
MVMRKVSRADYDIGEPVFAIRYDPDGEDPKTLAVFTSSRQARQYVERVYPTFKKVLARRRPDHIIVEYNNGFDSWIIIEKTQLNPPLPGPDREQLQDVALPFDKEPV